MIDRFISWLYTRNIWGSRCDEYDPECGCCEAWAIHDWLFNGLAHPEERNEALWAGQERPMTGFIRTLSDEQIARIKEYDGPISAEIRKKGL